MWRGGLVALTACGRIGFDRVDDATPVFGPWSPPELVGELDSSVEEDDPTLTGDMLEIYFNTARGGGLDVWFATRTSRTDPFDPPAPLAIVNTAADETTPEISADGLTLYFASSRPGVGAADIWVTTRASRTDAWSPPSLVMELCSTASDESPTITADGLTMYFDTDRLSLFVDTIFVATRTDATSAWSAPMRVSDVDGPDEEENPYLDASARALWMTVQKNGLYDLYVASRPSPDAPFEMPQAVADVNTPGNDVDVWVSPDLRTMYFASDRSGQYAIYRTTR